MSDHYYSEKPTVKSDRYKITETILGKVYEFFVDRGVFSKGGLDFGTRLLLESIDLSSTDGPVADVGCGWGAIGIVLADEYSNRKIVMVDINERAVELSHVNAQKNGVENVQIFQNDLLSGFEENGFSVIVTNPPIRAGKKVVFQLYEQASETLIPGGEIWVVIQKKQGAPSTKKKLEELGFDVQVVNKSKGYYIFKGIKS